MQKNWSNINVDQNLLVKEILQFFEKNYFDVQVNETKTYRQILAKRSPNYAIDGQVEVVIDGKPEEFSVKMDLKKNKSRFPPLPPISTTLFGGGFLILQGCKSDESWMDFHKDFWEYVNKTVASLSWSANALKESL